MIQPKEISIKYLFILTDEIYLFFISNQKDEEEIFLINKNELVFLKILQKKNFKNFIQYTTKELFNDKQDVLLLQPDLNNTKLIIYNKSFSHKYDSYLYKLFFQIFKYK